MLLFNRVIGLCGIAGMAIAGTACSGGGGGSIPTTSTSSLTSSDNSRVVSSGPRQSQVLGTNGGAATTAYSETPRASDALVDSVGVVTHFNYFGTAYVDQFASVKNLLVASHIRHIRDGIRNDLPFYASELAQLYASGIHVDACMVLNQPVSDIVTFNSTLPHVLESIEGANEYDTYGDPNWVNNLAAYQRQLYSGVKATPALANLPVLSPSLVKYEDYAALGNMSSYVDGGNMHNYFGNANPGNSGGGSFPVGKYGSIAFFMNSAALVSGSKPVYTTETGYQDILSEHDAVLPSVKVKYAMRTVLEQFNWRVAKTYFYEFVDEGSQNYGFVASNLQAKPVYHAFQSLLGKLSDSSSIPATPLSYTLTASPSVHHTLLQKHDGSYRLMLWIESSATDPAQQSQQIVVTPNGKFPTATQYEWQDDGSIKTIGLKQVGTGSISLTISDRVTELKLQQW